MDYRDWGRGDLARDERRSTDSWSDGGRRYRSDDTGPGRYRADGGIDDDGLVPSGPYAPTATPTYRTPSRRRGADRDDADRYIPDWAAGLDTGRAAAGGGPAAVAEPTVDTVRRGRHRGADPSSGDSPRSRFAPRADPARADPDVEVGGGRYPGEGFDTGRIDPGTPGRAAPDVGRGRRRRADDEEAAPGPVSGRAGVGVRFPADEGPGVRFPADEAPRVADPEPRRQGRRRAADDEDSAGARRSGRFIESKPWDTSGAPLADSAEIAQWIRSPDPDRKRGGSDDIDRWWDRTADPEEWARPARDRLELDRKRPELDRGRPEPGRESSRWEQDTGLIFRDRERDPEPEPDPVRWRPEGERLPRETGTGYRDRDSRATETTAGYQDRDTRAAKSGATYRDTGTGYGRAGTVYGRAGGAGEDTARDDYAGGGAGGRGGTGYRDTGSRYDDPEIGFRDRDRGDRYADTGPWDRFTDTTEWDRSELTRMDPELFRDRDRDQGRDQDRERERGRDQDRDWERGRDQDRDWDWDRGRAGDRDGPGRAETFWSGTRLAGDDPRWANTPASAPRSPAGGYLFPEPPLEFPELRERSSGSPRAGRSAFDARDARSGGPTRPGPASGAALGPATRAGTSARAGSPTRTGTAPRGGAGLRSGAAVRGGSVARTGAAPRPGAAVQSSRPAGWAGRGFASASASASSSRRRLEDDLLDPNPGGPFRAVLFAAAWYVVPVLAFLAWLWTLDTSVPAGCVTDVTGGGCDSERARAMASVVGAAPRFGTALASSLVCAVVFRWWGSTWRARTVGLAAAVAGGGISTVLLSVISGQPIGG